MGVKVELVDDGKNDSEGVLVGNGGRDVLEKKINLLNTVGDQSSLETTIQLTSKYPQSLQRLHSGSPIDDFPDPLIPDHLQLLLTRLVPFLPRQACLSLLTSLWD
jgi:hypothetical protein